MAEIEIRMASMADIPLITKIDLDFESNYVWKSQMIDDLDSYTIVFQNIKLPKTVHVPFQGGGEEAIEKMVKRQEVIVAQYDNQVAGFVRLEQDENTNRILLKTGGVKPDYRRKGIGSALLKMIQENAVKVGIPRLVCTVQAKNDPAIHFLLSKGFQFCGYQDFYFQNMEIALFFAKNIR